MVLDYESSKVLSVLKYSKDPCLVDAILGLITKTTALGQLPVYEFAKKYFETHHEYPDFAYMKAQYPDVYLEDEYTGKFSPNIFAEFVYKLRVEAAQLDGQKALADCDFKALSTICSSVGSTSGIEDYSIDEALGEYWRLAEDDSSGICIGIDKVDQVVKGFTFGTTTVIAAPPSQFKTTAAINAAYLALRGEFKVAFLTFEIPKRNMYYNFLSRHSAYIGDPLQAELLHKGMVDPASKEAVSEMVEDFKSVVKNNLTVLGAEDFPVLDRSFLDKTWGDLEEKMGGLDVVILDYIQLLRYYTPPKEDQVQFVNGLITYFSLLSKTYKGGRGLVVILLSQMNRDAQNKLEATQGTKGALNTALAEFNALERDAHYVMMLFSSLSMRHSNRVMVQITKNRTGQTMPDMEEVYVDPGVFVMGNRTYDGVFDFAEPQALVSRMVDTRSNGNMFGMDDGGGGGDGGLA